VRSSRSRASTTISEQKAGRSFATPKNRVTLCCCRPVYERSGPGGYGDTTDASALVGTQGNPGTVNLGGTLDIVTVGSPPVGTTFDVGNSGWVDVNGTFSSLDSGTETYTASYEPNIVTVTVATYLLQKLRTLQGMGDPERDELAGCNGCDTDVQRDGACSILIRL
jgi:hypothetical protein